MRVINVSIISMGAYPPPRGRLSGIVNCTQLAPAWGFIIRQI